METCEHGISGYCGACCLLDEPVKSRDSTAALVAQLEAARGLLKRVQRWRPCADQDPSTYDAHQRKTLQLTLDIEAFEAGTVAPLTPTHAALAAQVAELTRERDEARGNHALERTDRQHFESEVTRLTEALAAAEQKNRIDAEIIRNLTRRLGDIELMTRGTISGLVKQRDDAEAELTRADGINGREIKLRAAAEARVRELEARLERCKEWRWFEEQLAAANALLERCQKAVSPVSLLGRDLDAHLAAQPATAPAVYHSRPGSDVFVRDERATAPDRDEAVFEVQGRSWPAGTHPARDEEPPRG